MLMSVPGLHVSHLLGDIEMYAEKNEREFKRSPQARW